MRISLMLASLFVDCKLNAAGDDGDEKKRVKNSCRSFYSNKVKDGGEKRL